jgi:hypothetical protein
MAGARLERMEFTTELRWFWPEEEPALGRAAVDRLTSGLGLESEGERTDRYLLFPTPAVGVKVREGKLEIKHRLGARFDPEARGVIEAWVKWSGPAAPALAEPASTDASERWIAVQKNRRSVTLAFERGGLRQVPRDQAGDHGCTLELTALEVHHDGSARRFWTVGLEAYADPAQQESWLRGTRRRFAAELESLPCAPAVSGSYPEWLHRLGP